MAQTGSLYAKTSLPVCMKIMEKTEGSAAPKNCANNSNQDSEAEFRAEGSRRIRTLIVEDNVSDSELMLYALKKGGFETECEVVQTADEFADKIRKNKYDVILADYRLPGWTGMEAVTILRQEDLDIPIVLVSGALGDLKAVECIKQGAADYVLKDHLTLLPQSVGRAIKGATFYFTLGVSQSREEIAKVMTAGENYA